MKAVITASIPKLCQCPKRSWLTTVFITYVGLIIVEAVVMSAVFPKIGLLVTYTTLNSAAISKLGLIVQSSLFYIHQNFLYQLKTWANICPIKHLTVYLSGVLHPYAAQLYVCFFSLCWDNLWLSEARQLYDNYGLLLAYLFCGLFCVL